MLDHRIVSATIVDGTMSAASTGDIGMRDGRIVSIVPAGTLTEDARHTIDATGLVACPGFVDPHTHYDAQLFWDPPAASSSLHGVTSIIGGNCGFMLAPLDPRDADYTRQTTGIVARFIALKGALKETKS